jgi:hypothetical protein
MYDGSDNILNAFQMQTKAIVIMACENAKTHTADRKIISHKIEVYSNKDDSL